MKSTALLLLLMLLVGQVLAQSLQVDHRISFPERQKQLVAVSSRIPVSGDEVILIMPSWTPGSYLIRDYAAQVERFEAEGVGGIQLPVKKITKNQWRVSCSGEQEITVNYSVWAGELAVNTSWIERDFAVLNGAAIFMYSESSRDLPQELSVELPDEWKKIHTAMIQRDNGPAFRVADYDELVDSPLLLGNATDYPFKVENQEYRLVNQGESSLWDGEKSSRDLAAIVKAVQDFWGVNPFDRPYLFLNIIAEGKGGLEHDHSTVMLASHWQMRYREDYIRWLSLAAHEFFHAWNVRRMRPAVLQEYDYQQEVFIRELWLAEGLTSYYDNLMPLRAGLISVDEYFTLLAGEIHKYETTPGRQIRSAELASFDTWIKHYKPDSNSINSTVSYYRKGSLIGFITDTAIRRQTKNKQSLDTLMREMYRLYGPGGSIEQGYPPGAFEALVETTSNPEIRREVDDLLSTTKDPDIDAALEWYGLKLDRAPARTAAEAAGGHGPVDFGLVWNKESVNLTVEVVLSDGSGATAGILPQDELLAINGFRVSKDNIADRLLRLLPGESANLLLVRHEQILNLTVPVQDAVPLKYQISIRPDITSRQKQRMTEWLGIKLKFVSG